MLLDVLEVVAPVKHFSKLREFVEMKLPPGFPVKVDIPILPTITTRVNFQDFEFRNNMPDTLFQIPKDYTENPGRYFYKLATISIQIKFKVSFRLPVICYSVQN